MEGYLFLPYYITFIVWKIISIQALIVFLNLDLFAGLLYPVVHMVHGSVEVV
jgi:hypothetical protein